MAAYVEIELYLRSIEATAQHMRSSVALRTRRAGEAAAQRDPVHGEAQFDLQALLACQHEPLQYGQQLSAALFGSPQILAEFVRARTIAEALAMPLHLRLRLDEDGPLLQTLRWETLQDPAAGTSLLTSENVLFARHMDSDADDWRPVHLPAQNELRALVVIANPGNLGAFNLHPIDVDGELQRATASLGAIPATTLATPGSATLDNIVASLRDGHQLLYLVCHGQLHKGESWLFLEDGDGLVERSPGAALAARVREMTRAPLMVLLASCQSAGEGRSSDGGVLAALGPQLTRAGVPVVIAMQGNVSMQTVAAFTPALFRELQRDGQVYRAVAVARGAVRRQPDWWVPVLFTRLEGGSVFSTSPGQRERVVPFHADAPPSHFIARRELESLAVRLQESGDNGPAVTAIVGMGGSGKSTLARALAHETALREHFRDGVLWITLGQQATVLPALVDRLQALGDYEFHATTVEAASQRLDDLLQDRQLLLVLDDAWYAEDVRPFLVGGSQCHVLLTTRRREVADDVDAAGYALGVMDTQQALALLHRLIDREITGDEKNAARAVARAVGYLPLALELVAARVKRGASWQALQEALQAEVGRLEALEPSRRRRRKGEIRLEASLNASLSWLRGEDEEAWRAFVALGVLPEDVTIAAPMAATLWGGMALDETADLLAFLQEEALLTPVAQERVGQRLWATYVLHDLLRDLARRLLTAAAPQGLGQTLPQANAALLARYRDQTQEGKWHTLPDDGYIQRRLTTHLQAAGRKDEIHALLQEENAQGHNGWYEAREAIGQPGGFVGDVLQAWQLSEGAPADYGLQCRYALIISTLNSLASNCPTPLLRRLVAEGIWAPAYALAYARQIGDPALRAQALAVVLPTFEEALREPLVEDALEALGSVQGTGFAEALAALLPSLPPRAIAQVLALLPAMDDGQVQAEALRILAPALLAEHERAALHACRAIADAWARARALAQLAQTWQRQDLFAEALGVAAGIEWQATRGDRAGAFADVLACLPAKQWPEVVAQVGAIQLLDDRSWIWAEARLMPFYGAQEQAARLEKLLPLAEQMSFDRLYYQWPAPKAVKTLLEVTPYLSLEEAERLWTAAFERIDMVDEKVELLARHAGELPPAIVAREGGPLVERVSVAAAPDFINAVAPYLPMGEIDAEELSAHIEEVLTPEQVYPLALIIAHLPQERRALPARAALQRMRTVYDVDLRVQAIAALAPSLATEDLKDALAAVMQVDDAPARFTAQKAFDALLQNERQEEPDRGEFQEMRQGALDELLNKVAESDQEEQAAKQLADGATQLWYPPQREEVISALVDGAATLGRLRAAGQALSLIDDESVRVQWAAALTSHMQPAAIAALYASTWDESDPSASPWYRAHLRAALTLPLLEALDGDASLAPELVALLEKAVREGALRGLPDSPRHHLRTILLNQGIRAARGLFDSREKAFILARLARIMRPDQRRGAYREALATVMRLSGRARKTRAKWQTVDEDRPIGGGERDYLLGLAALLPQEMLDEALNKARGMAGAERRAQMLSALVPHLSAAQFEAALQLARGLGDRRLRVVVLREMAPHLLAPELGEALALARLVADDGLRLHAMLPLLRRAADVAPELLAEYWAPALRLASRATRPTFLQHLQTLAPVLMAMGGKGAVAGAREAVVDVGRWWP